MAPFAEISELQGRLDWTLDVDESRIGTDALIDLSDWARHYGREWPDPALAPRLVKTLVLSAAARYVRNPEGYVQSRAGDETVILPDRGDEAGAATFNTREIKALQALAGKTGIVSVAVTAWGPQRNMGASYVPVGYGGDPFPLYANADDPW